MEHTRDTDVDAADAPFEPRAPVGATIFAPAAAAPVEDFQPLDMNNPNAIEMEQMEDPVLVQHMIDARVRFLEELEKRPDPAELKACDVDNRKMLTELNTLVYDLKTEVNDFFAHLGGPNFAREYNQREQKMMDNLRKSIQKLNLLQTGYNKLVKCLYE